jgi:hypothetical protein
VLCCAWLCHTDASSVVPPPHTHTHSETWDLSGLSPPASAAATASRMLWTAQSAGKDASDAVGKAAAESLQSLASQDEDEYYMNPTDPTRVSAAVV